MTTQQRAHKAPPASAALRDELIAAFEDGDWRFAFIVDNKGERQGAQRYGVRVLIAVPEIADYSLHVASVCGLHIDRQNRIHLEGAPHAIVLEDHPKRVGSYLEGALDRALEGYAVTGYTP